MSFSAEKTVPLRVVDLVLAAPRDKAHGARSGFQITNDRSVISDSVTLLASSFFVPISTKRSP